MIQSRLNEENLLKVAVNIFGVRDYNHVPNAKWEDNIAEILERLENFVKEVDEKRRLLLQPGKH